MVFVKAPAARTPSLSVVEQVTNQIVDMVLSGEFKPGQSLPITDLSTLLGVSHIPVREALRKLEGDGLIEYQRGKGAQVAPVSEADLRAIFQLRRVIELDVARRSVGLLDAPQLALAGAQMEALQLAMSGSATASVSPAHRGFHEALMPGASPWDRRFLTQLWTSSERYLQLYLGSVRREAEARRAIVAEHRQLLELAASGDADAYVDAVEKHIGWSENEIMPEVSHFES